MLTRNSFIRFLCIIIISSVIICASAAYGDYAPGQIMVKFKPGIVKIPRGIRVAGVKAATVSAASVRSLNARHGVVKIEQLYKKALEVRPEWTYLEDDYVLYFARDKNVLKLAEDYQKDPNVISAFPSSIVRAFVIPDDPKFSNQYGLTNIQAPQAWDRTTGSSSVLIAVLDTGIDSDHEDFAGRIDPQGYDFVNEDSDPEDDYGHGTEVSGVIGAATNNSKGIAGVDWQAKILPIKVLNSVGEGNMTDIKQGITYAYSLNVDVINMSFGQYNEGDNKYVEENPGGIKDKCQEAYDKNVVLVAAAGNGDVDWCTYPAYYSTVLAVAAVDQSDERSIWWNIDPVTLRRQASNYGSWIDVSAPGTYIWSTNIEDNKYARYSGTSLACPFVAGLAGLVKAVNPSLTNQQIMDKIKDTADDIGIDNLGSGRINAYLAVAGIAAQITSPGNSAYVKGKVNIYGDASGWDFSNYVLEAFQDGSLATTIEASSISVESGGILGTWETAGVNGGHSIKLRVFSTGSDTEEAQVGIFVDNTTPEVEITSPTHEATVEGEITIIGTAEDQYLERYILEYGEGDSPSNYETIKESYVSVDAGVLGAWETAGLEGRYTIRLTAYDKVDTSATKSIKVNIRSTSPTREVTPQAGLPLTYALPNPFNRQVTSEVTFNYSLEGNFDAKIYLFDLLGNLIWQKSYLAGENGGKAGKNNPAWDGRNLFGENVPNGVSIYQIVADRKIIARGKVIVLN